MEKLRFLTAENLDQIRIDFGTPSFVYDEELLRANAQAVKNFPNAFGLLPRYAHEISTYRSDTKNIQ